MARIQVKVGLRYVHNNQIFEVQGLLADTSCRVEQVDSGQEIVVSYDEILQAWMDGNLRFEVIGRNAVQDTQRSIKTGYGGDDLTDLPEVVRQEAWRRY